MRIGEVSVANVREERHRLTGAYHLAEDQRAVARLKRLASRSTPLRELCTDRGIFRGPIFKRIYAASREYGEPYVSAKDLVQAEVRPTRFLSRRLGSLLDELRLEEGMVLITCSGMNLGKAIWVRPDLAGLCATHDLIRVCPDPDRVPPGYLYSFLASRYGHAWIRKQIYGGNIKHVEPHHISELPIPRLGRAAEKQVHVLAEKATLLLENYRDTIEEATRLLFAEAGFCDIRAEEWNGSGPDLDFSVSLSSAQSFRALNHNPRSRDLLKRIRSGPHKALGEICAPGTLKRGSRFTRIDASPEHGVRLVGQKQAFSLRPEGRWISRSHVPSDVFAGDETVMIASSGTLGEAEVYCRPILVKGRWIDYAYSQYFLRVISGDDHLTGAYLFAFLRSQVAFRCLRSMSTGSKQQEIHLGLLRHFSIPVLGERMCQHITNLVRHAFVNIEESNKLSRKARSRIYQAIEESV